MDRYQVFIGPGINIVVDLEKGRIIREQVCAALAEDGNHDPKFIDLIIKFIEIRDVDKQKTLKYLARMIEELSNTPLSIIVEDRPKSKKFLTRLIERLRKPRPIIRREMPAHITDAIRRLTELVAKVREWED